MKYLEKIANVALFLFLLLIITLVEICWLPFGIFIGFVHSIRIALLYKVTIDDADDIIYIMAWPYEAMLKLYVILIIC